MKTGKLLLQWESSEDEFAWDDMISELQIILDRKNNHGGWYAKVHNFGWLKQAGHQAFKESDASKFLQKILPDTDCTFKIFNFGRGIAIQNYHHDSPTGNEWYYITPRKNIE